MANFQTYPYGSYQSPYYTQQMQGQVAPIPMQPSQQIQTQMMQQPQIIPPVQSQQANLSVVNQGNGMIWVPNFAAANDYIVAANNAVALWDSSSPYVYLKQADSTGKPTIKVYELVERDLNQRANIQPQAQFPDFNQFVKRDDLQGFITRDDLEEIISERLKRTVKSTAKKEEE